MRFFTPLILTLNLIMVTALVAAQGSPIGQSCSSSEAGELLCAVDPSMNNDNPYIIICNGEEWVLFANCGPGQGCAVTAIGVANCA
ncbi:hypothetical protein FB446DRAFT_755479 [Lentinula raphanica]|nr:hypothetical protein FB446DRAFT_755479 [Lentinula raphanica]